MKIAPLTAVGLTACALAGCGGSSNKTLSYSGFGKAANKVCKQATADVNAVSNKLTGKASQDAAVYDKLIPKLKAAHDKFAALKPPKALKADFVKFNTLTGAQTTVAAKAQKLAKAGNQSGYVALLQSLNANGKATDLEASKLGAADCTK
jgi:hypothetical protein